jgi:hypothetical protein
MKYRYKMNAVYLQGAFALLFFLGSLIFGDWIIAAVGGLVAFMLIRDCMIIKGTHFEIKKDRLERFVHGQVKQSIRFNNFEYVTRTRKNTKWVVVGHLKDQIVLRNSLENLDDLVTDVLEHLKDNKVVFIHHTITKNKA